MRKMIAFQKMLVTMLFPTCYGDGFKTKDTADKNLLTIYSIAVFILLIRFSTAGFMFGFSVTLLFFLHKVLVRNAFVFSLPVKRSFAMSGIYIFSGMFNLFFLLLFWGLLLLIMLIGSLLTFIFSGLFLLFEDPVFIQEKFVMFSLSLIYINLLTPSLLLKRKSHRIVGMTAVTVVFCLFVIMLGNQIGKNLWSSNILSHYLQYAPDGWLFVGVCLLVTMALSIVSILVAEFIEWYGRKHANVEKCTA